MNNNKYPTISEFKDFNILQEKLNEKELIYVEKICKEHEVDICSCSSDNEINCIAKLWIESLWTTEDLIQFVKSYQ